MQADEKEALLSLVYEGQDLGASFQPEKTCWKVWAPGADCVRLNLYTTGSDEEDGAERIESIFMEQGADGVWAWTRQGDCHGLYYTYTVERAGENTESWDPYARACGVNGLRSMVVDPGRTNPEGWEEDRTVHLSRPTDALIWETHVQDYSSDASSGMQYKGKYLAFTEADTCVPESEHAAPEESLATGIAWLKKMGVTHVQLQPVFDFVTVDERKTDGYNWGYDPLNYNVPEGSYATDPYHGEVRIREFKQMVAALHRAGIGVIMDVVYNHTSKVPVSCFDRLVPDYYYRQSADGKRANASGCGNEIASERPMVRSYIVDSMRYWAQEYHIDGFRMDLMGILDLETVREIRNMLNSLPDGESRLLYGEPWSALPVALDLRKHPAACKSNLKMFPRGVAIFSDDARNAIKGDAFDSLSKGFCNGGSGLEEAIRRTLCGWSGPELPAAFPSQSLIYDSIHDNYTLWDQLVHARLLPKEYFDYADPWLVAYNKLAAAVVLMSQGIPILHGGEEFARTKHGDPNSYKSGAKVNAICWSRLRDYRELADYYAGLAAIRRAFSPLRESTNDSVRNMVFLRCPRQCAAFTLPGKEADEWPMLAVLLNASDVPAEFRLASWGEYPLCDEWEILANETHAGLSSLGTVKGAVVKIPPRAAWILAGKKDGRTC